VRIASFLGEEARERELVPVPILGRKGHAIFVVAMKKLSDSKFSKSSLSKY
jgi:hypothetical protein